MKNKEQVLRRIEELYEKAIAVNDLGVAKDLLYLAASLVN